MVSVSLIHIKSNFGTVPIPYDTVQSVRIDTVILQNTTINDNLATILKLTLLEYVATKLLLLGSSYGNLILEQMQHFK